MLSRINPKTTSAWNDLQVHSEQMKSVHMRELFHSDVDRFKKFSLVFDDILIEYSKRRDS